MDKIAEIRMMFECLPERDIPIVNKFLDKRQFVEIKEIVDSDVAKFVKNNYNVIYSGNMIPTEEEFGIIEQYNILKDLQLVINSQAAAFIDENREEEEFYE